MKQVILTQFPWPWLTAVALVIFVTFFIGVCIRVSQRSQRQKNFEASHLPLNDEVIYNE